MRKRGGIIAATGLRAEARVAQRCGLVTALSCGGDEKRLVSLIDETVSAGGIDGIISFGIAGGLRPDLPSGTIVVGTSVIANGMTYDADERWSERLLELLPNAEPGAITASNSVIARPDDKQNLYEATGAFAADMESHVVAHLAMQYRLPFAVLRVIADPATQHLPPAAINGLKPDGTPNIGGVLKSLISQPGQFPDLLRAASATRRAMERLFSCHSLLSPGLGFADLR
ncbi:phosphorylase [Hyphomicrobium sp.]|uniref:phosphorylase family protein n=1 Tax=Hyphomicrobium sp. TaxID=82 RepID=UPI002D76F1EA|nr:phosphorylase [Hyphomicrobium sp.]HET6390456.1 phosphorylase [Hyphomicrobium sp.]